MSPYLHRHGFQRELFVFFYAIWQINENKTSREHQEPPIDCCNFLCFSFTKYLLQHFQITGPHLPDSVRVYELLGATEHGHWAVSCVSSYPANESRTPPCCPTDGLPAGPGNKRINSTPIVLIPTYISFMFPWPSFLTPYSLFFLLRCSSTVLCSLYLFCDLLTPPYPSPFSALSSAIFLWLSILSLSDSSLLPLPCYSNHLQSPIFLFCFPIRLRFLVYLFPTVPYQFSVILCQNCCLISICPYYSGPDTHTQIHLAMTSFLVFQMY